MSNERLHLYINYLSRVASSV